jgi:exosortase
LSPPAQAAVLSTLIQDIESAIRKTAPLFYVLIGLYAILYLDPFYAVWKAWTKENGYYSHGPLIPFVAAWMLYTRRDQLVKIPLKPNWWGMPILIASSLIFLVSTWCHMYPPKYVAFVFYLLGFSLLLFGTRMTRAALLPWAFLFFMVPLPDGIIDLITYRLRISVTAAAVHLTEPFDWYVVKSGNYILLPSGDKLVVGDVCAGLRSLISLLALGAVFGYLSRLGAWASLALFALSAPVAIITNILRIFALIVVAHFWGSEVASGQVHDISGWAIFVVAFGLMYLAYLVLERVCSRPHSGDLP